MFPMLRPLPQQFLSAMLTAYSIILSIALLFVACHRQTPDKGVKKIGNVGLSGLTLSKQAEANIGLRTEQAELRTIQRVVTIPGVIRPRFGAEAWASSKAAGVVIHVHITLGEAVQKGTRLAEIESPELQRLQVDLMQAHSNLLLQEANLQRIEILRSKNIASEKEALSIENEFKKAESEVKGLRKRLAILGLSNTEVTGVELGKPVPTLTVTSPIAGTVVEKYLTLGEAVEALKKLFRIVDLSDLIVEGDVSETFISQVHVGQRVRVRLVAFPDRVFDSDLFYVGDTVDPDKRSIRVRARITNPDRLLKPEMFAKIAIIVGEASEVLTIPRESVIGDAGRKFVFIKNGDVYLQQEVAVGMEDDRYVEITDGLYPGDLVVTRGCTELRAETLKPQLMGHQ